MVTVKKEPWTEEVRVKMEPGTKEDDNKVMKAGKDKENVEVIDLTSDTGESEKRKEADIPWGNNGGV